MKGKQIMDIKHITDIMAQNTNDQHIMTVAELIYQPEQIKDNSTPVYLESGQPVHYTTFGMNENETRFFIGVM